jgi:glyoxylase-like metal-dependent hydrolase (beta-lactamase superfamily II)
MNCRPCRAGTLLYLLVFIAPSIGAGAGNSTARPESVPSDWFHVIQLDESTYAVSEPKYWLKNVSYLLIGSRSSLLFDTGPSVHSIRPVVDRLTHVPVLVLPSHLHFDHVGRIEEFSRVALVSTPALRRQVIDGTLSESPEQYLLPTKHEFRVSRWLNSGEILDLGGRRITVLATPGHTPDSVSLVDPDHHRVFTGDLLNREGTLAAAPGSDIGELAVSLAAVVKYAPAGSVAYEAHSERPITGEELLRAGEHFQQIAAGRGTWQPLCIGGVSTRQFGTGDFNVIVPGESGQRLKPFPSLTTEVDSVVGPCPAH